MSDTTYQLLESAGNGAFGGTAVVAMLRDATPHLPRHSAIATISQPSGAVFVGTVVFAKADLRKANNTEFQSDVSGVPTSGFVPR